MLPGGLCVLCSSPSRDFRGAVLRAGCATAILSPAVNPSYFTPGYYPLFGAATDATSWEKVGDRSYSIMEKIAHPSTGLLPDWSDCQGLGAKESECSA